MSKRDSKSNVKAYVTNEGRRATQVIETPTNPIEALHAEFLTKPPTAGEATRAALKFVRQRMHRSEVSKSLVKLRKDYEKNRARLKAELERADGLVREASAELVRTHGRAPVEIDGVTYDASFQPAEGGGWVYWIPRVAPKRVPK